MGKKYETYINSKIEKWFINGIEKKKTKRFLVKCECGTEKTVDCSQLISGKSKSCGCDRYIKIGGENNKKWTGYGELSGKHWSSIVQSAKNRKLDFSISIEYAWNLFLKQDKKCALTKITLIFPSKSRLISSPKSTASLDRIDSSKGYIEGNVQWIHKDINLMKQSYTNEYLIYMAHQIAKNNIISSQNIEEIKKGSRYGKKPKNQDI